MFSSLENTDQPQNLVDLDWLNDAFKNHLISEEIFLELLRAKINVSSWYSYLGRNLNTNSNDWTNFIRLKSKDEYIARTSRHDSENVFLEYQSSISDKKFIPVYNTEIKLNSRQQKMIGFEISYVHIIRNPIRMYNEWIKSERVLRERMQSSRIMNIRKKNISDLSVENETADIIIENHINSLEFKNHIKFEDYCIRPKETMENIANICNVNLLPFKKNKLLDARVPRKIDEEYSLSIINFKIYLSIGLKC